MQRILQLFKALSTFSVHHPAKNHRRTGACRGSQNRRAGDGGGVHAAVLAAVGNHRDGDQLEGGDIHNKEGTHFPAGGSGRHRSSAEKPAAPPLFFEIFQIFHGF